MKAILRGGPKDGTVLEVLNVQRINIPTLYGMLVYYRTERLEGECVVFV